MRQQPLQQACRQFSNQAIRYKSPGHRRNRRFLPYDYFHERNREISRFYFLRTRAREAHARAKWTSLFQLWYDSQRQVSAASDAPGALESNSGASSAPSAAQTPEPTITTSQLAHTGDLISDRVARWARFVGDRITFDATSATFGVPPTNSDTTSATTTLDPTNWPPLPQPQQQQLQPQQQQLSPLRHIQQQRRQSRGYIIRRGVIERAIDAANAGPLATVSEGEAWSPTPPTSPRWTPPRQTTPPPQTPPTLRPMTPPDGNITTTAFHVPPSTLPPRPTTRPQTPPGYFAQSFHSTETASHQSGSFPAVAPLPSTTPRIALRRRLRRGAKTMTGQR
jgi:hypothetical protein